MKSHAISLSLKKAFTSVLFVLYAGTASLFADTFYLQVAQPYNETTSGYYTWGPSAPTAAQMASVVSQYMAIPVSVVTSPFLYEDTGYPPATVQYNGSGTHGPATTGRIWEFYPSNSPIVSGLTRAELRLSGTDFFYPNRNINRFVMRAYTATTYYDVLIRIYAASFGAGYGTGYYDFYQISAPRGLNALLNISARAQVGTGENQLFTGFYVLGNDSKEVLLRGMGPSYGLPGALQDPYLELRDSSGTLIASNNNWQDTQASKIQATGAAPGDARESAIVITLNPGSYTTTMSGVNSTSGAGVCEVYDLNQAANSQLVNLSGRANVGTGDNALFAGLIVGTTDSAGIKLIVRALGPSLGAAGIANPLQDPTLELYDANGTLLAYNNNWRDTQQSEIIASGAPPSDDRESAIVRNVPAGNYTAIARGINNTVGVGVVDTFKLQ